MYYDTLWKSWCPHLRRDIWKHILLLNMHIKSDHLLFDITGHFIAVTQNKKKCIVQYMTKRCRFTVIHNSDVNPCPCPCRSSPWQVLFLNLACKLQHAFYCTDCDLLI